MKINLPLFILIILLVFGFHNCKKDKVVLAKAKGRVMDSCGGSPIANANLNFFQNEVESPSGTRIVKEALLTTFKTDNNGFFEFEMPNAPSTGKSPYNASIRMRGDYLASGNFELDDVHGTIDLGNLYYNCISGESQLVFQNDQNFVSGDQIEITYFVMSPSYKYETVKANSGDKLIIPRTLKYQLKRVYKDSIASDWKYEGSLMVKWDFYSNSRPDVYKIYGFNAKGCGSQADSLFFKP